MLIRRKPLSSSQPKPLRIRRSRRLKIKFWKLTALRKKPLLRQKLNRKRKP